MFVKGFVLVGGGRTFKLQKERGTFKLEVFNRRGRGLNCCRRQGNLFQSRKVIFMCGGLERDFQVAVLAGILFYGRYFLSEEESSQ